MKQSLAVIAAVVLVVGLSLPSTSRGGETNPTYATIMAAAISNDVYGVLQALPAMEKLWPQEPVLYFQAAQPVAEVLAAASSNMVVRQALWDLFDRLLEKTCPTNNEQAAACFGQKKVTIAWFFNFKEVRYDRARLVQVAGFLGEIRSRRISNYQNRGGGGARREILRQALVRDPSQLSPEMQDSYAKAVEADRQDQIMDRLQNVLFSANGAFTSKILYCSSYLLEANAGFNAHQNAEFIEQLVAAAHLTDDERSWMTESEMERSRRPDRRSRFFGPGRQ
jgi:hypothetical protein